MTRSSSVAPRFAALCTLVALAALARLLPHPPNFTPVGALALFGGATFGDRRWSLLAPLAAMLLSDAVLGFHSGMPVVYAAFVAIVGIGLLLRGGRTPLRLVAASLAASVLFFVVTNFAVWAMGSMYPKSAGGLLACYVAAIPFFGNTLLGDAFFTAVLFGGLALAEWRIPAVRAEPRAAAA
jgi:hypothetical protein